MFKKILAVCFFCVGQNMYAQNSTYIGAEASVTNDVFEITDNGGHLKDIPLINGMWGFSIRQDINTKYFLETGVSRKYYTEGIGFKNIAGYSSGNSFTAWLIPIRFGSRINLYKQKLQFIPTFGFIYGINSDYGYGNGGGAGYVKESGGDSIHFSYTSNYIHSKTFPLIQAGLGLEFRVMKTAIVSFSTSYYAGLKKMIHQDISYTVNNSLPQNAIGESKADFLSIGIALKYQISNFWYKKSNEN